MSFLMESKGPTDARRIVDSLPCSPTSRHMTATYGDIARGAAVSSPGRERHIEQGLKHGPARSFCVGPHRRARVFFRQ